MGSVNMSRLTGELVGTAILVYFGASAALTTGDPLSGAICMMAAAAAAIWIFGAHVNPWLTIASAVRGTQDWMGALVIIAAQLVGGLVGALLMWATFGEEGVKAGLGSTHLTKATLLHGDKGIVAAIVAETLIVFLLSLVLFSVGDKPIAPIAIGLTLAVGSMIVGALTMASMNFARTLGPEIVISFEGSPDWGHIWIYLVSGLAGSVLAGLVYPLMKPAAN